MAHALHGYEGKCADIHGHTYHLEVTIIGKPVEDESDPNLGMVMDFSILKKLVQEEVLSRFDHALVLKVGDPRIIELKAGGRNLLTVPYQPTCENLLLGIAKNIGSRLNEPIRLHSLKLRETASSYASWYASDN